MHFDYDTLHYICDTMHFDYDTLHYICNTMHFDYNTLHYICDTMHFNRLGNFKTKGDTNLSWAMSPHRNSLVALEG